MNNIFSHIMFTIGDIDFLTCDQIVIILFDGSRLNGCQICSSLRFGEIHRPGPAPLDHRRHKDLFLRL